MQTGLTNQEIANELVISVYTVKRHITNIYNKMDVDNRVQAVHKAQQLGFFALN
jgi:ATP/maltotriose-dependent transcriptional regulator MalT